MASVVLSGDTSGSVTITAPAVAGSTTQTLVNVTGTLAPVVSGTVNAGGTNPFPSSAGPATVDFTGIPSWAKRITVMFQGVSTNGTSSIITQIGAGSFQLTGYTGSTWYANTTNTSNNTGILLTPTNAAAKIWDAIVTANLLNSATGLWVFSVIAGENPTASGVVGAGSKTLSGTLDRVRITTVNGTDLFDAGSINILYE